MMRASIFRLTPLFLLAAGLLALAVFLLHDARPAAAHHGVFWSATLTAQGSGSAKGCVGTGTTAPTECGMALTKAGLYIPLEPHEHRVAAIQAFASGVLQFGLNNEITSLSARPLTLTVDGRKFHSEDGRLVGGATLQWDNSGLSWSEGDTIELSLEQREHPSCADSPDSSLNPTDLRAFPGSGVLTLAWINPDTDRHLRYAVRWRKSGTTTWLNPHGAVGEAGSAYRKYTHDITGLEDGASYDVQVRIILTTAVSSHNDGHHLPRKCSGWVSVTGTTQAATPIWSATLTPQTVGDVLGCDDSDDTTANKCSTAGVLSPAQFSYGGNTYTVEKVKLTSGGQLQIFFDSPITGLTGFSLNVDGSSFFASLDGETNIVFWNGSGLSWSAGTPVKLSLVEMPPPTGITTTASGALREGGPPVNVFLALDHPALAGGGATVGTGDGNPATYLVPGIAEGAAAAVMQISVPEDEDDADNNCRTAAFTVTFPPQVAGGAYLSANFAFTVVDNDGAADTCTGLLGSPYATSLTLEISRVFEVEGEGWTRVHLLPRLDRPAVFGRFVIVDVSGSATRKTQKLVDDAAENDQPSGGDYWLNNTGLTIHAGSDKPTYTTSDGQGGTETRDFSIEIIILPNAADSETIFISVHSPEPSFLLASPLTLRVGNMRQRASGQNSPCAGCGTGADTVAVSRGQLQYAGLIVRMKEWRNDPEWVHEKAHTDRWDRALLAFGETVADTTLTPMTAAEAQGFADRGWERWVEVAAALRVLENQPPTVSSAIGDVTIVSDSGSHEVSLAGVFDDADGDGLTITAISSDEAKATASVASDGSTLTVTARLRGTATITVTANDGKGGTVDDSFTVTVKAAPLVASAIADVSGLAAGDTQDISLSGVFSDADGDALTVSAASGDDTIATVSVASGGASVTLTGVAEGTATVTVTAQDSDGNRVSDAFDVEVVKRFASLIAKMYQWRNDPQWVSEKAHTDRWDRALLAFGETVADATLTPMTAAEAQALADQSWGTRWVPVAKALWELQNRAPTVSSAIGDATIVNRLGTHAASLSGVFSDPDNDALTVTAASSDEAIATVSVAADGSSLTVSAQARGTATITVTANDGKGGTVEDSFTVTVKVAPDVASDIADVSGLEAGSTREVSLSGAFSDADGDALTVTASSDDEAIATVSVAADHSALTVAGVAEGTATVTVIAQDSDGNRVMDDFDVSVVARQQQQSATPNQAPTVSSAIGDATIVIESGSQTVSLAGVFSDADNDSLTVTASSSDETKATVSVAADYSSLTVNAQARGTATVTVTANDGKGGTVEDSFTVTVKAAPVVASALADLSLEEGATPEVSLSGVFSDADGDALTVTTDTTDENVVNAFAFQDTLYVTAFAAGTATITVTAQDSDGNTVSDTFDVSVVGPPTPVSNLTCVAQTGRVLFSWDAPQWSGAAVYAYDYDMTLPDGKREQSRLFGYPAVSGKGEYQAGQEAGISVKAVYELADGSQVSSEAATLTCTVAE